MNDVQDLLSLYGQWVADEEEPASARYARLADLVTALVEREVADPSVHRVERSGLPTLAFEYEGRDYLLSLAIDEAPGAVARAVSASGQSGLRADDRWVLLWWSGAGGQEGEIQRVADAVLGFGVVLDRTHVDAAVAGLRTLPDLVRDVFRRRRAHVPLGELLARPGPPSDPPPWVPAGRLPAPVPVAIQNSADVSADLVLVGGAGEARPTGLAVAANMLLVTTDEGVLEVHPVLGTARWLLQLPGCHGAPLISPAGELMVMCGPALVRSRDGAVTVVAGDFGNSGQLLAGPGGEPWVLSGSGVTFGAGEGTLALTRVGNAVGDQLRYRIVFEAAVRAAVWLEGRRFFLAAGGHSAVVDLGRSTDAGGREEWIRTAGHCPAHLLTAGATGVVSASPDGSGNHVLLHRTDLASGVGDLVADLRLAEVFGLAQAPEAGPAYLLGSLPQSDPRIVEPVLVRISGHRPAPPAGDTTPKEQPQHAYDEVSLSARGQKGDYRLERVPLAREGQGDVFRAEHKASGVTVAFKRRNRNNARAGRRMAREVQAAQVLGGHPHVMPVLDFSAGNDWFVMPLAAATAEERRAELQDPAELRALVDAVASALTAAHNIGWLHRDIKPANILLLDGRWVLADWGIVRRPRGQTSSLGVLTGAEIGTPGFAAPELSASGHDAPLSSDIYSLGQVIGWILTGTWPRPNVPLLPPPGPWYGVVRRATHPDPAQRPQTVEAFLDLVEREIAPAGGLPIVRARRLSQAAQEGDASAAGQLLALAADMPDDYEILLEVIATLDVRAAKAALLADVARAVAVVRALADQAGGDAQGNWPRYEEADRAILWLLNVAILAARKKQWPLLDAAATGMCEWDGRFDQWKPQSAIKQWLRSLAGEAAAVVAAVLRAHPESARHLHELTAERAVDVVLRSAIHNAAN